MSLEPIWQEDDAARLMFLREQADLSTRSLAKQFLLSLGQLNQLERGGSSYFYNEKIKYNTGKKILNSFNEQTIFDKNFAVADHYTNTSTMLNVESPPQTELINTDSVFKNEFINSLIQEKFENLSINNYTILLILPLISVALYFSINYWNQSTTQSNPVPKVIEIKKDVQSDTSSSIPSPTTSNVETQTPIEQAVALKPASLGNTNDPCNWTTTTQKFSTETPSKPGNYVYLIAIKSLVVCVKDSTGRITLAKLKANETKNITGQPPFSIFSDDARELKVFFQGTRVSIPVNVVNFELIEQQTMSSSVP
jgi:transcriptional regulator with XRE-family HTH domain